MDLSLLQRDTWHPGQVMAYSAVDGATDFELGLVLGTAAEPAGLEVKWPGQARLKFTGDPLPGMVLSGDFFEFQTAAGPVRGAMLNACHLLVEGGCEVVSKSGVVESASFQNRLLIGSRAHFDKGLLEADLDVALEMRKRWLSRCPMPQGLSPEAGRTLAKAYAVMKTQVFSPENFISHRWCAPSRWPRQGLSLRDTLFSAIGFRHLDSSLARDMLRAVMDAQQGNGFVPQSARPGGVSTLIQCPMLALGVKLVYEAKPLDIFIEEMYPRLGAYVSWILKHRDAEEGGLARWQLEKEPEKRGSESGAVNSPRFDGLVPLEAPDLNAMLAMECGILAEFAQKLGLPRDTERWGGERDRLNRLINERLWSEEHGLYYDYDPAEKALTGVPAYSGFWPMLSGAPSPAQVDRLAGHLGDPASFGSPLPVPSVGAGPHYSKDMWRGPAWPGVNWLIAYGLDRYNRKYLAREFRVRMAAEIERCCGKYGVLFEFFDDRREVDPPRLPRLGKASVREDSIHQVIHDYGPTAALYADFVLMGGEK